MERVSRFEIRDELDIAAGIERTKGESEREARTCIHQYVAAIDGIPLDPFCRSVGKDSISVPSSRISVSARARVGSYS